MRKIIGLKKLKNNLITFQFILLTHNKQKTDYNKTIDELVKTVQVWLTFLFFQIVITKNVNEKSFNFFG